MEIHFIVLVKVPVHLEHNLKGNDMELVVNTCNQVMSAPMPLMKSGPVRVECSVEEHMKGVE